MQIWHPYANGHTSRTSLYVHRRYQSNEEVHRFNEIEEDIYSITESIRNHYDLQSASVVGIHSHYHDDELVTVSTEVDMPISAPLAPEDNAMPPEGRGNVYVIPETATVKEPSLGIGQHTWRSSPPFMTVRPTPPPLKDAKEVATIRSACLDTGVLVHEMYSTPWKPLREGVIVDCVGSLEGEWKVTGWQYRQGKLHNNSELEADTQAGIHKEFGTWSSSLDISFGIWDIAGTRQGDHEFLQCMRAKETVKGPNDLRTRSRNLELEAKERIGKGVGGGTKHLRQNGQWEGGRQMDGWKKERKANSIWRQALMPGPTEPEVRYLAITSEIYWTRMAVYTFVRAFHQKVQSPGIVKRMRAFGQTVSQAFTKLRGASAPLSVQVKIN
ncbi:hypothetical protein FB451DRAFT_1168738 [Mycena latifolia]|nr:hypothetical protein FB451DRAFT_1168738 [Mycena latifolia]